MSSLLEKALEKVGALPPEEQDAIASQILASLADEEAWKRRFAEKREVIRRMAQEALAEDERGETLAALRRRQRTRQHRIHPRGKLRIGPIHRLGKFFQDLAFTVDDIGFRVHKGSVVLVDLRIARR